MDQMKTAARKKPGFSLLELLVVMTILVLLISFAAPAFQSMVAGSNLTRAGQLVGDQIVLARQGAVTGNAELQVVFFRLTDGPTKGWRAVQIWRLEQTAAGVKTRPLGRVETFPDGVILSDDPGLSPLLTASPLSTGTAALPSHGTVDYAGFRFRANGSTENAISEMNNFVTLQNATETAKPPHNYYTLQINPVTGKVTAFQP